jgi:tetratricopeptide (TPR) repeat protein
MNMTRAAFAAALLASAAPALAQAGYSRPMPQVPVPTPAQPSAQTPTPTAPQRPYHLSRQEQQAFQPVLVAANAHDWATAQTALATAAPQAQSADAKYLVGQLHLQIGVGLNNTQLQAQGIDEMVASGGAQPAELRPLYSNQLAFALQAGDAARAERAAAQLDTLNPNDPDRLMRHAQIRELGHDPAGALAFYQQAIQAKQAAGQPIPVEWRQQMAGIAYRAHLPQTVSLMRDWLAAAPSPLLWHDTLAIYGESVDDSLKLDIYRLIRAAGAMRGERDYIVLADAAAGVRAIGEVKSVLDEGLSRNLITTNVAYARERLGAINPRVAEDRASMVNERRAALAGSDGVAALRLGDSFYGYGQYAEAAELYRAAIQKGGVDANLAQLRLGEALALAGQRSDAEAAFRAVSGPRGQVAQFWLLWLSTPHA